MALNFCHGLSMKPIKENEFTGHLNRLREIFKKRAFSPKTEVFTFDFTPVRAGNIYVRLRGNSSTEGASDDDGIETMCAVLHQWEKKNILFSYGETWQPVGTKYSQKIEFSSASIQFFVGYEFGAGRLTKQIFRLEWENFKRRDQPNEAAHPHWQFDRWLTETDAQTLASIRSNLQKEQSPERPFESAQSAAAPREPDLSWLKRIHFPSNAQWATNPIRSISMPDQPHRSIPESVGQLEDWLSSALCYVDNEIKRYAWRT